MNCLLRSSKRYYRTAKQFKKIDKEYVHLKLQNLFRDSRFVFELSKVTRILPYYFSMTILQRFISSIELQQKYITFLTRFNNSKRNNKKKAQYNTSIPEIQRLRTINPAIIKDQKLIECYIDYLTNNPHTSNFGSNVSQFGNDVKIDMNINDQIMKMIDMREPQKWFFETRRRYERTFIYHHGPTNSGKTHSAIEALKNLKSDEKGIYMAPLRLLAWQIQQKLVHCNLITGQEKEYRNSNLTSCTIQTLNVMQQYDLAVIDEIQMLGDLQRGWSWSRALLGVKAKVVHLCGDERALSLVSRILETTGETLFQRRYARRSKLKLIHKKFQYQNLQPGDCLIAFSVDILYKQRSKINKLKINRSKNGYIANFHQSPQSEFNTMQERIAPIRGQTAIIYGKLPPQCRRNQAKMFNQRTLPYLVATNAIGMGLNLNINRIVFLSLQKRNSFGMVVDVEDHQIRQIAGRAGRNSNHGYTQCLNGQILKRVTKALKGVNETYNNTKFDKSSLALDPNLSSSNIKNENLFEQIQDFLQDQYHQGLKTQSHIEDIPVDAMVSETEALLDRQLTINEKKIGRAGLLVQFQTLERVKLELERIVEKKVTLAETLTLFMQLALKDQSLFFIQDYYGILHLLEAIQSLGLQREDQFAFACIPIMVSPTLSERWIVKMATEFITDGYVKISSEIISDFQSNFNRLNMRRDLGTLQNYHNFLDCYLWLWGKFQLAFFEHQKAKQIMKSICSKIDQILITATD